MSIYRVSSIALSLTLSLFGYQALSDETNFSESIERLTEQSNIQLRSELVLLDVAIKSIETTQFLNDYAGGLDRLNVWIAVPSVLLAGTEMAVQGARLSDGLVRGLTPAKAKWFDEYDELKIASRNAKRAYQKAIRFGEASAQDLQVRMLQAENALTSKLLRRPGQLYRLGRFLRFMGRSTVFVGGVALTALTFNEGIMLSIGRHQMNNYLERFKQRATVLEGLLGYQ